ncbi:DUF1376 domain-containing protein [Nitrosovibrio sp. Nv17]|uniref:YdaU family protein n=1 Tax=Nitrosovibrio sp. Nv17 TaxID=1855339 RepID=UPI000908DE48|nr:DUF1376 domain-containing protein [Nitrosovibrio sp. Nv17]SFW21104.1 Uncharacterized conserved protein YdaU, DUF1376 family [Nitrosovibrio sp. Nv17]
MNYYERYCGDYQRDTAHLSLAEHGAYTMLLDTYFSVEKPLPRELPALFRICRAMTRMEQQAVTAVAEQFFPISENDGLRHNIRADREIAKARPRIEAARVNGRKGGRPPRHRLAGDESEPEGLSMASCEPEAGISQQRAERESAGKAPQHQHQLHRDRDDFHTRIGGSSIHPARPPDSLPTFTHASRTDHGDDGAGGTSPGLAGACCRGMALHGVRACNPHHPVLLALLKAGATEDEFVQAARSAAARGKANFAYVVGTVRRQREEAARLVLHRGRMPNRQELLEASNRAATDEWRPPELRNGKAQTSEPEEEVSRAD